MKLTLAQFQQLVRYANRYGPFRVINPTLPLKVQEALQRKRDAIVEAYAQFRREELPRLGEMFDTEKQESVRWEPKNSGPLELDDEINPDLP